MLVQRLLRAKRDLVLERELNRLDSFDAVFLDDLGYVQQERDEMEVLFTFFAARYEHRSVIITSNLVFSQWDRIFKDPMTTATAIDRLVHHSVILELVSKRSFRADAAFERNDNPMEALTTVPESQENQGTEHQPVGNSSCRRGPPLCGIRVPPVRIL